MRQLRKDQNSVSSQTSCLRKYHQCCCGFLFWLLCWLCPSDVFLENLLIISQAGSCELWLTSSSTATFRCCLPAELLESLLGGWWTRWTPTHQSFTFRRQKIPSDYLLFHCQILGKISLRTALTGVTWNWFAPPGVRARMGSMTSHAWVELVFFLF